MTYSIVARDPETGDMGCAVQSHYFSVGPIVPNGEAGVGVVATQAMAEPGYGPRGLALMRTGLTVPDALRALVDADAQREQRQVAMLDAAGHVAAHTGARCIAHAAHRTDDGVSVQANMMERDTVPDAMLAAYRSHRGGLAGRMLAALDAAEAEGGDIRGRQSAAILIVAAKSTGRPWVDRSIDLRVEDHPEPLGELRRLVTLRRAYHMSDRGFQMMRGGDAAAGLEEMRRGLELAPDSAELTFWYGLAVATSQPDEARRLIAEAVRAEPRWAELLRRLPAAGMFPDDPALIDSLLAPGG